MRLKRIRSGCWLCKTSKVSPSITPTALTVKSAASDGQRPKTISQETSKTNLKVSMPQLTELTSHKAKMLRETNLNLCKTPQL
jgi:hypothetical protein